MPDPGSEGVVAARLAALKDATAAAHRQIEARAVLARLLSPEVTLQDYGRALQRLHLHFSRHEAGVMRALAGHLPADRLAARAALPGLAADLADLGLDPPLAPPAPPPPCPASAAGWLYVHEGTSLGGLVLKSRLQRSLGDTLGQAIRHYARHGRATAARWQETRRMIAQMMPDDAALGRAIAGASAAFAEMDRVMADAAPDVPEPAPAPNLTPNPAPKSPPESPGALSGCPFAAARRAGMPRG